MGERTEGPGEGRRERENELGESESIEAGAEVVGRKEEVEGGAVLRPPPFWSWRKAARVLLFEGERREERMSGGRPAWYCISGVGASAVGVGVEEGRVVKRVESEASILEEEVLAG